MTGSFGGFKRWLGLFALLLFILGCQERQESLSPSVYLLNHEQWTPILVLNFAQEVAPSDAVGKPPAPAPQLEPPAEGQWRWQDSSRLIFLPKDKTFQPGTRLKIALQGVNLRDGYGLANQSLSYQTPPLSIVRQECRFRDIPEAPIRRRLEAVVEFNYPVENPVFAATIGENLALPLHASGKSRITVISDPVARPDRDGNLSFNVKPGPIQLRDLNTAGATSTLAKGAGCQLPLLRSAWDKLEEQAPKPPKVTDIDVGLNDGKLNVRLQGRDLKESAKKAAAGQEVKSGVTMNPTVSGTWNYGDSASGADLIFTPEHPQDLKPGTGYEISVAAAAFPQLVFDKPKIAKTFKAQPMTGSIGNVRLYSDPNDAKIKRITATLSFSFPPQKDSLAAKTSVRLRLEPAKSFDDQRVQSIAFELAYDDKNPNLAYLKTAPITIPEEPGEVRVIVEKGLVSSLGGEPTLNGAERNFPIPGARDYLKFTEARAESAIKNNGDIERLLILHTSLALKDASSLPQSVEAYLLPDCGETAKPAPCEEKSIEQWQTAEQVDAEVLKLSSRIPLAWRESSEEDKTLHYLSFSAPEKRQLLIKVNKGVESVDGFKLAEDARYLVGLGENQKELKILHDGALLSLSGSKKLGVAVRGLDKVHVELQRVLPHNMHHLAQFTRGEFQNPEFKLPIEHFAEKIGYDETLPAGKEMERRYFAVDFSRFVRDKGYPPRGLFLLKVAEKKPPAAACSPDDSANTADAADQENAETGEAGQEAPAGCGGASEAGQESAEGEAIIQDQRLVLLTDLGMLVKTAKDGRQGVFVMSFRSGLPVAGAQVWLLGKNGVAVASGKTDASGYAELPSVEGLKEEKTPSVYLVEKDNDLSFLPYSRKNRLLDLSRFDIDGLKDAADSLHAYLFSDRGIYRPGDNIHIGLILRKRDWSALPSGLPLKAVITDPEDQEVWSQTLTFGGEGFEELAWASPGAGKTGTYRVELFLAEKTDPSGQTNPSGKAEKKSLGSTTIRVEEFQPDRLQVKTEILGAKPLGWLSPEASKAKVTVRNLFGTPAAGNPAKLEMTVRPWSGQVPGFAEYHFRGSIATDIPHLPQDLGEIVTDSQGEAQFDLPLAGIDEPVFEITLAGEGFEKGTGRSVVSVASSLVSRHPFLLGYAADGSLDYIAKGSLRNLKLQALGPDFKPKDAGAIAAEIYEKRFVSTLVKREDGLYAYQSSERDEPRKTLSLALAEGKAGLNLPTENPGRFFVVFKNAEGEELNRAAYSVAGEGNVSRNIERNAELNLSLNKKEYQPGEEIELQIVAPYQGAGLITIEQDGVIASQWFKSATTSSTHRIVLPKGASGNAYLSVAFVRSLDSQEIYMSPLSYGVASFAISRQAFSNELTLSVPETVQPGTHLDVHYRLKEAAKLVLYAVDEGILQFAHYRDPAPLDFFFRKRALQTKTHQILDLILPDYALVQKLSASGGDEDAETFGKYKNPFARKHKPPMAFWSGILEASPGEHVLSIPVPDYFNGTIRVLAVAANAGKLASPVTRTVARNPFVIQPQQPLVVAPGDEFDLGVLVANTTSERGELAVSVAADEALELRSANPQMLNLGPGEDGIVRFKAKAREKLGPVKVRYQVTGAGRETGYGEEMSIRPTQPLLTTSQNGVLRIEEQRTGKSRTLDLQREVYDEQRYTEIAVSMTPTAYLRGIVEYLKNYPYGCTEQLSSQAFPAVVLGANQELGLSSEDAQRLFGRVLQILQTRQKHDGSFGYWSVSGTTHPFYSLYATQLLLEARERGLKTSDAMFERAMHYADQYSQERHYSWPEHEAQAYALYLLARNGQNIAERLRAFEAELARQWGQGGDSANQARFFLGAAYKLHHLDQDADRFFGEFQRQWKKTGLLPWNIQNSPETMSLYLYLINKHFPELVDTKDPQFGRYLLELAQDMVKQRTNSFRGSLALLGLGSLWDRFDREEGKSFNIVTGKPPAPLPLQGKTVKRAALERGMRPIEVRGDGVWNLYYQLTERGYDKAPPAIAVSQGISISRLLLNEKGEKIGELDLQDKLHIRFSLHPDRAMKNVAVVMLIPGGFEIDLGEEGLASRQSLKIADKPLWQPEYIDVQEDRVVFFGDLEGGEKFFEFRLKPLNSGVYSVPPVFAEGMYDTDIQYRGLAETIKVKE